MRIILSRKYPACLLLIFLISASGCSPFQKGGGRENQTGSIPAAEDSTSVLEEIPAYSGKAFYVIKGNLPDFSEKQFTTLSYEHYSALDSLGRCGQAEACIGKDLMPSGERGDISMIHPSGWQHKEYSFIDGRSLYNRCHLIAYQLAGEGANEDNLITGTRYLNTEGMLSFEEETGDYVRRTGNHVLYRVTPVFDGNDLIASGVEMEGESVEDRGKSITFHVFCYNVQPGIEIDYSDGTS